MSSIPGFGVEGRTWGRYRVDRLLGAGGMGIVYRAVHVDLGRPVAIKILKPDLALEPGLLERFKAEARAAASLNHPNLAVVHDVGEADGFHYFVMDLVEGEDLAALIDRQGRLSVEQALALAEQIARALDHAHGRGVVHRDVKPQNTLLAQDGTVKVTDFGIARALEGSRMTATGTLVGTPEYLAPEQALGQPTDARADVYALGIVLFEMLTGHVPFSAETPVAVALHQINTPPPSPSTLVPGIPPEVETLVMRALAKRPDERFPSAGVLAEALGRARRSVESPRLTQQLPTEQVRAGIQTSVLPVQATETPGTPTRETRGVKTVAVAGFVVVLLGVGAVAYAVTRNRGGPGSVAIRPSASPQPRASPMLEVTSVPGGAAVHLDEVREGTTPFRKRMEPGVYVVELRKAGFKPWRGRVSLGADGRKLTVTLTPLPSVSPTLRPPDTRPTTPPRRAPPPGPRQTQPPTIPPKPPTQAPTPRPQPTRTTVPTPLPTEQPIIPAPPG